MYDILKQKECDYMGIFNRAIPNIQTNNLNQVRVTPPEEYYVDDIFDPLFNAKVKEQLRVKYGNPFLGTIGGYMEGIDNALLGQDDKWGILGSGMGILSGFGRSMDKAGDFIIGGLTESVKGLTGQGFENPLRNIFVEDEDYTGTRLLAAMGNSMAKLAKAPQLTESDFRGLWNIPAMGLELATDPGIVGNAVVKSARPLNLAKQVSEQSANSNLADIGQLLSEYDDFMAKVSMDMTAPGLRLGAKSLLDKIHQKLGSSSAKGWANISLDPNETPEARAQAATNLAEDSQTQSLMQMADTVTEIDKVLSQNAVQAGIGISTTVPAAVQEELEDLFEYRDIDMIKRGMDIVNSETLQKSKALKTSDDKIITALHDQLFKDDSSYAKSEREIFNELSTDPRTVSNLDLRTDSNLTEDIASAETYLDDYRKLSKAVSTVRSLDKNSLNTLGINPEYASLDLFDGVDVDLIDDYLQHSDDYLEEVNGNFVDTYEGKLIKDYLKNNIYKGQFYSLTDNEATQNAVMRLAGIDPKSRRVRSLPTPVTLSPSDFAGRTDASYRASVQASYTLLKNAFDRAGIPFENFTKPLHVNALINDPAFKRVFPKESVRKQIVDDLRTLLFPGAESAVKGSSFKGDARAYMQTVEDLVRTVIDNARVNRADATPFLELAEEAASKAGIPVPEYLNDLRKRYTLIPWVQSQTGSLTGKLRVEFLDDLKKLDATFNLESAKSQKALTRIVDLIERRDAIVKHITSKNPLPNVKSSIYDTVKRAQDKDIRIALNEEFTPYEKGLLTRIDNLGLYDFSNVKRSLETSELYQDFWDNTVRKYYLRAKGSESQLYHSLVEASERIQKDILDPVARRQGMVYDINPLSLKEPGTRTDKLQYSKDSASKQYEGGKRRAKSASDVLSYQYNAAINNFYRLNADIFDDPEKFKIFLEEHAPKLAKHYQVKLKPEYFAPQDMSIHKALSKDTPHRTRAVAQYATDILDEFYTLFDDDVALLLKNGISPTTPLSKFKRYANNAHVYDTLKRVQTNLGKVPYTDVPKNYKAYNYLLNKIFPIEYIPTGKFNRFGKEIKRPFIIDYYKYSEWDSPIRLQLTEIPTKELNLTDAVNIINANISADYLPPIPVRSSSEKLAAEMYSFTVDGARKQRVYKSAYADRVVDAVLSNIQEAPVDEAAEIITAFPTRTESVKSELAEALGVPKYLVKNPDESGTPPDPPKTPSEPPKGAGEILYPKEQRTLAQLINDAVVADSRAKSGNKATLRSKYVKEILDDAALLMTKKGITEDAISKYKRVQTYLNGAGIRKEEFLDTLASSGMFQMAFKPSQKFDKIYTRIQHNVAEVNVAMGSNVLKPFKYKLTNGNTVVGAMWDTSNRDILNVVEKNFKKVNTSKLQDIVRLDKGVASGEISKYIASKEYRMIDELFDKVRQQEGEYAKMLGFTYDTSRHVKNVRNISPDVGNYLANIVYKDLPINDLDKISDKMMGLSVFKHLRGSWGTRKFDRRFIGYIEDFEADGLRIFSDDASKIVKGSFGEGSFNNAKFQLYVDLFDNDNFRISQFASKPEDLERILYAKLEDGSQSGNLHNLVLAAPRRDSTGRVIGFTQFDKTTSVGLQQALDNPDTVLLPAHVFAPLDRVLRKDAKMSNKVFAWVNRHLTLPFKFGVLMNPGFLLGNANDAYLKQATTMAHKYGTSVSEELVNVAVASRDVLVLNNKFDDAYRKFLVHIQAEGFPIAPSNNISELAATDPRIRKMLKDYVNDKLKKSANSPLLDCALSKDERNTVKLWLMLNSISTSAAFDRGFQDLDSVAQAMNKSKYQMPKSPVERILMGKGEYVSSDLSTWGLLANNPASRTVMRLSETTENIARASTILNDFRHKGMDEKWFGEYFNSLDELKEATKSDPTSLRFREKLREDFNVNMSEAINTMHSANFDYERMTDFTDTVGTFVPFPTFFLKNLGYWLEVLVNHPQYIDHAITVQESLWGSRDTSKDKFAAEAKGRGAVPISVGGQNLSKFFKGIYKPTPLQSMFGAFSLINNPVEDVYYRLHPALSGGITAASQIEPLKSITADLLPSDSVKYRPYSTDMYERNVTRDDPNFNPVSYAIHRANPVERSVQAALRLPDKLSQDKAQLSDFLPSIFQPDFGEKYSQ